MQYKYKVVCAWCGKLIAIKRTSDERMEGAVSHSICQKCFKEKFEEGGEENEQTSDSLSYQRFERARG